MFFLLLYVYIFYLYISLSKFLALYPMSFHDTCQSQVESSVNLRVFWINLLNWEKSIKKRY